jgi:hypothetical protein
MNPLNQNALMHRKKECTAAVAYAGLGLDCHEGSGRHVAAAGEFSGRRVQ